MRFHRQHDEQVRIAVQRSRKYGHEVAEGNHLEQLTELAFLAAVTDRIRIVPSVMIVPHRNPLVDAKMLATT